MKRNYKTVWAVCSSARKTYRNQLDRGIDVRRKCLSHCLSTTYRDYHEFDRDFSDVKGRLLDSRQFNDECKELGITPEHVAEHVIYAGKTTYTNVRDKGVKVVLGKHAKEYNHQLHV